jgi:tripartite-type tricarboxylate transporter receptor subunit TctC
VEYPAGGIVDIVTRVVTDKLAADWGQPIVIEPKPGANGNFAWAQVACAEPDGYTWTFFGPGAIANPRMQPSVKWNEDSFVVVGGVVWAPSVIVINPSVPANTVAEFIAHAKKNPGALNWVNPSIGASQHLNTAIFIDATKVEMVAVSYRGQWPSRDSFRHGVALLSGNQHPEPTGSRRATPPHPISTHLGTSPLMSTQRTITDIC